MLGFDLFDDEVLAEYEGPAPSHSTTWCWGATIAGTDGSTCTPGFVGGTCAFRRQPRTLLQNRQPRTLLHSLFIPHRSRPLQEQVLRELPRARHRRAGIACSRADGRADGALHEQQLIGRLLEGRAAEPRRRRVPAAQQHRHVREPVARRLSRGTTRQRCVGYNAVAMAEEWRRPHDGRQGHARARRDADALGRTASRIVDTARGRCGGGLERST